MFLHLSVDRQQHNEPRGPAGIRRHIRKLLKRIIRGATMEQTRQGATQGVTHCHVALLHHPRDSSDGVVVGMEGMEGIEGIEGMR